MNNSILRSRITLRNWTLSDFAKAMSWHKSTARRKLNGTSLFTAPEIQKIQNLFQLTSNEITEIFFTVKVS